MMKAYDWMKPARGIFDFQKDWGGVRRRSEKYIFKKFVFDRKFA